MRYAVFGRTPCGLCPQGRKKIAVFFIQTRRKNMKKGFTLIELLVVVLIIGILSAIALPQYTTAVEKARSSEAITLMGTLRYAAERYRLQTGDFPGADLSSLDIELPNVTCTGTTCTSSTKNFKISGSGTDTYTIKAQRIGSDGKDGNYYLQTVVKSDGSATRSCTGSDTDGTKICNAISSGKPTDF